MRPILLLLVAAVLACGSTPPPRPFASDVGEIHDGARLVVVGDLQRTAPILEAGKEQNDAERERIVGAIADARPDLLAITGDCVFNGGSEIEWSRFDALVAPLHDRGVAALGVFGNHEYWLGRTLAEKHLLSRFPLDRRRHWFTVAFGPLRLVALDGNDSQLSQREWADQLAFYDAALHAFDDDRSVRGVLVLVHQAPFTNSDLFDQGSRIRQDFVPPLLARTNTMGMLAGHVHSYERFLRGGKTFVVSGGGGGPRRDLATGAARRFADEEFCEASPRDFNFTVYTLRPDGLEAKVMGLAKGATEVRAIDAFTMPWPPGVPAASGCVERP